MVACGTISCALSDGYHAMVVPFPTHEHHMVDELSGMIECRTGFGSSLRNVLANPKQTVMHSLEVPDLTHEINVELFRGWDRKAAGYLQVLRYIRISYIYIKHRPGESCCVAARSAPSSSLGHQGGDSGDYGERRYRGDGYYGMVIDDDGNWGSSPRWVHSPPSCPFLASMPVVRIWSTHHIRVHGCETTVLISSHGTPTS